MNRLLRGIRVFVGVLCVAAGLFSGVIGLCWAGCFAWLWLKGELLSAGDRHGLLGSAAAGIAGGLVFRAGVLLLRGRSAAGTNGGTLRLSRTPPQRRRKANAAFGGTLLWLGVGAEACLLCSHGNFQDRVVGTLAALVPIYLGLQAIILCHELGHLLCAALLGLDLQKLQVGTGPALLKGRCGGLRVEWRAWFGGGLVLTADEREAGWRGRHWIYVAGGPAASLACCLGLAWWIGHPHPRVPWFNPASGVAGIVAIYLLGHAVLMLLLCLWPRQGRVGIVLAHTDGYQLLHTPRFTPEKVRNVVIVTILRRVDLLWEEGRREAAWNRLREILARFPGAHVLAGAEAYLLAEQGDHAAAAASFEHGLQTEGLPEAARRMLTVKRFKALVQAGEPEAARQCGAEALGMTPPNQRASLLDGLATEVLMLDRADFLPDAEGWSQQALGLEPGKITLKGTRGSILVALGRHEEGAAMLREVWAGSASEVDAAIAAFYLGRAAKSRGNVREARRWFKRSGSFAPYVGDWLTQRLQREKASDGTLINPQTPPTFPPPLSPAKASELPPPLPRQPGPWPAPKRRSYPVVEVLVVGAALLLVVGPVVWAVYGVTHQAGYWRKLRGSLVATLARSGRHGMVEVAREPIPRGSLASTEEADRRAKFAWAQRTMRDAYDRVGRRNPRWNNQARALLDHTLPWWAGLHDAKLLPADLLPQAREVLRLGCDDPLVLYLAGVLEARVDPQSAVPSVLLTRAVLGFQGTSYVRGVAMAAATETVADCERRRDGTGQSEPVKKWWVYWFGQALRDGSFSPTEQTALAGMLSQGQGATLFEGNRQACCQAVDAAGAERVAPWLQLWLSGKRHLQDAWDARGGSYADTVTPEGWRGFASGLAAARSDLVASWQVNPRRPEAAALMISVAMGQSTRGADGPRAWFDRAVRAQVDYDPAYTRFLQTLTPQWGGSIDAVLTFGLSCAATADYDTGVPLQLNNAADMMDADQGYANPEVYAALERMYAGYEAAPSQTAYRVFYHDRHARAAELTGRYAEAYQILRGVDFRLTPEMTAELASREESGNYIERIAAYGGAGGADAQAGNESVANGHPAQALERFQAALKAEGTEPRAAVYLQSRIGTLATQRQLEAGQWIAFQPQAGTGGLPVGWTNKLGNWHVAPDGALVGQAGARGLMLVSDATVGTDFEMRGELDFLPGAMGEEQSGVMFGHPDMEGEEWQSFRLKRHGPDGSIATISCHWHEGPTQPMTVPDHNTFVLQSWHGQTTLTVNGQVMFREQPLGAGQVTDGSVRVGLGGYSHHGNIFAVAYRKLELRRLDKSPGVAGLDPQARNLVVARSGAPL